jgi:hypothetical protein
VYIIAFESISVKYIPLPSKFPCLLTPGGYTLKD